MTERIFRECPYDDHRSLPCLAKAIDVLDLPTACKPGEYGRVCGGAVMRAAIVNELGENGDFPESFRGTRMVDYAVSKVNGRYPTRTIQDVNLPE